MLAIETNEILFKILKADATLAGNITGGIYSGERPDNSAKEDIVVNTISFTKTNPQTGTSNVNVHVPDRKVKINGVEQYKADTARLKEIGTLVQNILEAGKTKNGVIYNLGTETVLEEDGAEGPEHYINFRVNWLICK